MKCEVMNKKEVPKSVKETATPPFVLMRVPGRVAKVEHWTAVVRQDNYTRLSSQRISIWEWT